VKDNRETMQSVYEAAGGRDGLLRLACAWHTRVLEDEVVSHAFTHGYHPQHTERLAAYWAVALGGPATYSDRYADETSVLRIHSGNGPHGDGPAGDRLFRSGAGRCRPRQGDRECFAVLDYVNERAFRARVRSSTP
jgi:Bacterial-like globin